MHKSPRIIIIGELGVDIDYTDTLNAAPSPGGRLLNAACILARRGFNVEMVGDMGIDPMGDIVMNKLVQSGVGVRSVDRYSDGLTPVTFYFGDKAVKYSQQPADGLNVVWPRVHPGDIVVFGGYYAVDPRVRTRLMQLINHLADRNCKLIYLPGYMASLAPRITRVMPALLENLEIADLVVTRQNDLRLLYGDDAEDPERCYLDHVYYYSQAMINVDPVDGKKTSFVSRNRRIERFTPPADGLSIQWMAAWLADLIENIAHNGLPTIE